MNIRKMLATFTTAAALASASFAAIADESGPISLVVPFSAGGPSDAVARLAAKSLSDSLHRPIVVENKPGATGMIGAGYVLRARPDGQTLLAGTKSALISGPLLNRDVKIDAATDFVPIDFIAQDDLLLLASSKTHFSTVKQFVSYAKSHPGELTYGTSGLGSSYHFDTELLSSISGIEMLHVPYNGAAPAFQDLLAGRIDIQLQTFSQARAYLDTDRVTVLAVISQKRLPELPEVPTYFEGTDIKPFDSAVWTGLFAPKGTPVSTLTEMRHAMEQTKNSPNFQQALKSQGLRLVTRKPAEITAQIQSEIDVWKSLISSGRVALH